MNEKGERIPIHNGAMEHAIPIVQTKGNFSKNIWLIVASPCYRATSDVEYGGGVNNRRGMEWAAHDFMQKCKNDRAHGAMAH